METYRNPVILFNRQGKEFQTYRSNRFQYKNTTLLDIDSRIRDLEGYPDAATFAANIRPPLKGVFYVELLQAEIELPPAFDESYIYLVIKNMEGEMMSAETTELPSTTATLLVTSGENVAAHCAFGRLQIDHDDAAAEKLIYSRDGDYRVRKFFQIPLEKLSRLHIELRTFDNELLDMTDRRCSFLFEVAAAGG